MAYVRFQTTDINKKSGRPVGIFTLVHQLLDKSIFPEKEELEVRALLAWFQHNMPMPDYKETAGISWLKDDQREMIEKFSQLKGFLESAGHPIDFMTVLDPGKIIYEDFFQVVAI